MRIDIMTLFPEMCEAFLSESIIGRARAAGHVDIRCVNIRDYAGNKHNRVDDYPYGGGTGMVMQPNPIYDCYQAVTEEGARKCHLIYMTPQGKTLTQERVRELSEMDDLVFLCGHYEGVDERVIEEIVDEEISIGDYVLTGGELPTPSRRRATTATSSNTPSTPVPPSGRAGKCRTCCSPETTARWTGGGSNRPWPAPMSGGRTCWKLRKHPAI